VAATARRDADMELDELRRKLAKTQADLANKTLQIKGDQDVRLQVAHIEADSRERVAEIQAASRERLDAVDAQLNRFSTTTTDSQPAAER
jgi:multidrug resistance efflux pump